MGNKAAMLDGGLVQHTAGFLSTLKDLSNTETTTAY
jgi:hypothetical protein